MIRNIQRYRLRILTTVLALGVAHVAMAQQEQWGDGGEIESVEIEIVKERQITLPRANRNFDKIPPRPAEPILPPMTYDFKGFRFNTPDFQPSIKPLKLKQEELQKITSGYVSAGFGNFASPFLSASISSKRNANRHYGADFLHRSFGSGPVGDKNSASGNTNLGLFMSGINDAIAASMKVNYENRVNHFFGYQPSKQEVKRDTIRQVFNTFSLAGLIENAKPSDFNYQLKGTFSYLTDYYRAVESDAGVGFNSQYKVSEKNQVLFTTDYRLLARKDSLVEAKPRHLFKAGAAYQFAAIDKLNVRAGLLVAYENDTLGKNNAVHVYPDIYATYQLSKTVEAFGGFGGDMERVSLHSLSKENPWVNSNINIFHANKALDINAGLNGRVGASFLFKFGIAAKAYQNLYFFKNHVGQPEKFDVIYDDVTITNPFGEWGFKKGEKVSITMRGEYFAYSMKREAEAWHRPDYRVSLYSNFNMANKLTLAANLIGQGGMKAFNNTTNKVVTLKTAMDLQLRATYFVSKNFSCYVEGNNLLNSNYPLFLNYPVRGLQVSGGVGWSF